MSRWLWLRRHADTSFGLLELQRERIKGIRPGGVPGPDVVLYVLAAIALRQVARQATAGTALPGAKQLGSDFDEAVPNLQGFRRDLAHARWDVLKGALWLDQTVLVPSGDGEATIAFDLDQVHSAATALYQGLRELLDEVC